MTTRDQTRGIVLGLGAAALFGVSAPLSRELVGDVHPVLLAGLLYLGAALALSVARLVRRGSAEAALSRADVPRAVAMIAAGGVLGPVLMLLGLRGVSAVAGSLLLGLEGPLTALVAVVAFREHLSRRGWLALGVVLVGAAALRFEAGALHASWAGFALLAGACACWALDNNLSQALSLKDPLALVQLKTAAAGAFNLALGLALTDTLPRAPAVAAALALGSVSYGASVVMDAWALRLLGAARESVVFATAPVAGVLVALVLGERLQAADLAAMALMALGVGALLRERHSHVHAHEALTHEHLHEHDEHHQHAHSPLDPAGSPHAHAHRHEALVHEHRHVSDAHHRHPH